MDCTWSHAGPSGRMRRTLTDSSDLAWNSTLLLSRSVHIPHSTNLGPSRRDDSGPNSDLVPNSYLPCLLGLARDPSSRPSRPSRPSRSSRSSRPRNGGMMIMIYHYCSFGPSDCSDKPEAEFGTRDQDWRRVGTSWANSANSAKKARGERIEARD